MPILAPSRPPLLPVAPPHSASVAAHVGSSAPEPSMAIGTRPNSVDAPSWSKNERACISISARIAPASILALAWPHALRCIVFSDTENSGRKKSSFIN